MNRLCSFMTLLAACQASPLVVGKFGDAGVGGACDRNSDCGTGTCCTHVCTDLNRDTQNCGACGTACPAANVCQAGACTSPPAAPDGGPNTCPPVGRACSSIISCLCADGTIHAGGDCYPPNSCDVICCNRGGGQPTNRCGVSSDCLLVGTSCGQCATGSPCEIACVNGACVKHDCTAGSDGGTCDPQTVSDFVAAHKSCVGDPDCVALCTLGASCDFRAVNRAGAALFPASFAGCPFAQCATTCLPGKCTASSCTP